MTKKKKLQRLLNKLSALENKPLRKEVVVKSQKVIVKPNLRKVARAIKRTEKDLVTKIETGLKKRDEVVKSEIGEITKQITKEIKTLSENLSKEVESTKSSINQDKENAKKELEEVKTLAKDLEDRFFMAISGLEPRGGNMNRQIKVEGVNPLTTYTDINFVSSGSSPITTSVDHTNKRVNISIPSGGTPQARPYVRQAAMGADTVDITDVASKQSLDELVTKLVTNGVLT